MTIRVGEIGKSLYVFTAFDMSANTGLEITFKSPAGVSFTRTNPDVTAPNVDSPNIPGQGILPANRYLVYSTQEQDFNSTGEWCINSVYIEGTEKKFIGSSGTLTVSPLC